MSETDHIDSRFLLRQARKGCSPAALGRHYPSCYLQISSLRPSQDAPWALSATNRRLASADWPSRNSVGLYTCAACVPRQTEGRLPWPLGDTEESQQSVPARRDRLNLANPPISHPPLLCIPAQKSSLTSSSAHQLPVCRFPHVMEQLNPSVCE